MQKEVPSFCVPVLVPDIFVELEHIIELFT